MEERGTHWKPARPKKPCSYCLFLKLRGFLCSSTFVPVLLRMYSPPPYALALLSSRLVRIWTQTIGGHMRHHSRYSTFVHNTFPLPALSPEQHRVLAENSRSILKARARHAGKAIAWLYNPETMPSDLLLAHQENDAYIEEHIYGRKFRDDAHRLEHLFAMYERIKGKSEASPLALSLLQPIREPA